MEGSKTKMMNKKISIYQQQQKYYWSQTFEQDKNKTLKTKLQKQTPSHRH